jgi:threonine dehydrogenase-like Zn-dependent dehydrogenase
MKALLFDGTLRYVDDYPMPEPAEGEALIRVTMAGICDTDIQITKGYLGFQGIPGHEFVGTVERVNGPDEGWAGRRVVGEINCGCGACNWCRRGLERHCPTRATLGILGRNGAFAEYLTLPVGNLHEVPERVADEEAVFTEPLAAAFEMTEQVHIRPTDRVLVMGDGKLGILCALVLKLTQANVTLLGKHDEKLQVAARLGITQSFQLKTQNSKLKTIFDVVVDATGSPAGFETALQYVRPRGTIVLKTTTAHGKEVNLAPVVINEVTVVGSRCGPFAPALRALASRTVDVKPLIGAVLPFTNALEAFQMVTEGSFLKVLLAFENSSPLDAGGP